MSHRTKNWAGWLATAAGLAGLLALAGCYATAGRGAYYAQPQPVYYAPAPAQVQVQTEGVYYAQPAPQQPVYYVQPAQQQPPVYYVQPAPQPPVYYVQPQSTVEVHGGWGRGRRHRAVNVQQGGGVPVRVEVQGAAPAAAGSVQVR